MKTFSTFLTLVLVGCSTVPIPIPQESGSAIVVARDDGFLGSGCKVAVRIDGKVEGMLSRGQFVRKSILPGKHKVSAGTGTYAGSTLCANQLLTHVVDVAEEQVTFRIGYTTNYQFIFDRIE